MQARSGMDGVIVFQQIYDFFFFFFIKVKGLIKRTSFSSADLPTAGVEPTTSENGPLYKTNFSTLDHSTTATRLGMIF